MSAVDQPATESGLLYPLDPEVVAAFAEVFDDPAIQRRFFEMLRGADASSPTGGAS
jgi:hypothetical protein